MAIQRYADAVMANGPVGYWRLGEAPGSAIAADTSGNGGNGNVSGGVTFGLPGFHGGDTAALFDGVTGRIIVPNSNELNPCYITMEAKVRWDGPNDFDNTIEQRILEKSSYKEQAQYALKITPTGHVKVDIRTSSATSNPPEAISIKPVVQGVETHIVATYKDNIVRIYLNGIPDPSGPISMPGGDGTISRKTPTPQNLIESGVGIGNQTQRDRPFNGLIDEVALFPVALSADQILAHYLAQQVTFQYAAKLVCGKSTGKVVAPGVYFTAVNVHNPTYKPIDLRVKVAVALPGLQSGPISKFHDAKLGPDGALEIDCPDIYNSEIFKFPEPIGRGFLKGFVVIESEIELDVVAVYTAVGSEKVLETMHMERVPVRRLSKALHEVCVDFEPPLTVGTQYGAPAGHSPGDLIFTSHGIPVSVFEYNRSGGGTTFNIASIGLPPIPFGMGQNMSLDYINLEFDYSSLGFVPNEVSFEFLDRTGDGNISVNGSPVLPVDFAKLPASIGTVKISVSTTPVGGGKTGKVILTGAIKTLRVGGVELWIDNVCARE